MSNDSALRNLFARMVLTPLFICLPLITGCTWRQTSTPVLPAVLTDEKLVGVRQSKVKNCLFIILDTTHAAHLSAWGYHRATTPNLDRLAANGVRFEQAYSQASSTLPSTWSILSGRYPVPPADKELLRLDDRVKTLAENFKDSGFATFGYSENPFVSESFGHAQGFDTFDLLLPLNDMQYADRNQDATEQILGKAAESIHSASNTPWFTYIHLFRPHAPYFAPEPFGTAFMTDQGKSVASLALETALLSGESTPELNSAIDSLTDNVEYVVASYDGNLAYADRLVGKFLAHLHESGELDETLVIVASDHGEELMQRGRIGHGLTLFEEQVHVPLIVWGPSIHGFKSGSITEPVAMIDLYPTLTELFSLAEPAELAGTSLTPFLRGQTRTQALPIFAQTQTSDKVSVRMGNEKMIAQINLTERTISQTMVFNLHDDKAEKINLWRQDRPFANLRSTLQRYINNWPEHFQTQPFSVPEEQLEQLRALGYLN